MRTTLDIDDEILRAATDIARRERKSPGQVLSELARRALAHGDGVDDQESFLGFEPFGHRGGTVTDEVVNALRDEGEY